MKRVPQLIVLMGLLACVQCSEVSSPTTRQEVLPSLDGLIVSGVSTAGSVSTSATSDAGVTYVSLRPGTLPLTSTVEIRNRTRNGSAVRISTVEGGFDPVAIEANADDRLDVTVFEPNGTATAYSMTVPKRRPPTIVRTNPPKGRTDVAFNIRPTIIFTEPINAGTLTTASVRLLENGVPVPVTVALGPGNTWTADVTPAAPLKPSTTYQLLITQDVRDLDGDALEEPVAIEFATAPADFDVNPTGRIAFVNYVDRVGGYVWVANADGSGLKRLPGGPANYSSPRWSPDGRRIAVARWEGDNPMVSLIDVIDVDGVSGWVRLGEGANPSWSPDGTRIAFTSRAQGGISVMNADGSNVKQLTEPNDRGQCPQGFSAVDLRPDWSPDGRKIVFERQFSTYDDGGYDCGLDGWGYRPQIFVMNADGSGLRPLILNVSPMYDSEPAWSPDGKRIAFSFSTGILSLIDADGVGLLEYVFTMADYDGRGRRQPSWSPEGKHILFLSIAQENNRFFIVELASGKGRRLVFPIVAGFLFDPSWGRTP